MMTQQKKYVKEKKDINLKFEPLVDIFQMFDLSMFPYSSKVSFLPLIDYWKNKLNSKVRVEQILAEEILQMLKQKDDLLKNPIENLKDLEGQEDLIELLISPFIPFHDKDALLRVTGPFNTLPFYHSKALNDLLSNTLIETNLNQNPKRVSRLIIYRAGGMILNEFYNQQLQLNIEYLFSAKQEGSKLEQHFRTEIDDRFTKVIQLKPLKKLNDSQIRALLSNVEDTKLWLEYLPPSNFEFQGVISTLLTDSSITETLSRLKNKLLQRDALLNDEKIRLLENDLCTFFKQPDLKLGVSTVENETLRGLNKKYGIKHGLINDTYPNLLKSKNKDSIYNKVVENNDFLVIDDLRFYAHPTELESELLSRGINNILIAPLKNKDHQIIGLLELGSPNPYKLNSLSVVKLKGIISLFNVAIERSQTEIVNQLEAIIREHFTSIHPCIEWAFVENAFQILQQEEDGEFLDEDRFVFRDNYPLYGQADIVDSTVTRNAAIQRDLIDNLYQIKKLLNLSNIHFPFPLTDQVSQEVDTYIYKLKREINSNSEFLVMEFIKNEVHPLLRYLKKKSPLIREAFHRYWNNLDPQLGTVYKKRKDYEKSVAMINRIISTYLAKQQEVAQKMCPHYYEKFQTDGVAYNIYIGQSLLKKGKFTQLQLKNLRLWQLIGMCEITRKIAELQPHLPTCLTTAQLVFVHSSPLSIRFRVDEKRFDVDGAYNARYEIIKKRIDKAVIEGTNERLTVQGKIAIVYQQENDRKEYLRYLNYLIKRGYIEKGIEELLLKKMQGVQGLKALRVTVKILSNI